MRVLYVSGCLEQQCGVYQFGKNVGEALQKSTCYEFVPVDCGGWSDLERAFARFHPTAMVYNYHPSTLPWVTSSVTRRFNVPQIGTIHECSQATVDAATNEVFDAHMAPDPTLAERNPLVHKTGRLILPYTNSHPLPEVPTIGSFGFGLEGKGFERVIETVQREFDDAHIRLHIPFSPIMDPTGTFAAEIRQRCERLIDKPGIRLSLSHEFLGQPEMLEFLAGNSLNAFFYDQYRNRGLSSSTDYALAVGRPVALTRSEMFRHFSASGADVYIEGTTLRQIMARGFAPLEPLRKLWSDENLAQDYERAVSHLLAEPPRRSFQRRYPMLARGQSIVRRLRHRLGVGASSF